MLFRVPSNNNIPLDLFNWSLDIGCPCALFSDTNRVKSDINHVSMQKA